ncbi:unnamed protein product [Sympodiomycopsis kandeliae]
MSSSPHSPRLAQTHHASHSQASLSSLSPAPPPSSLALHLSSLQSATTTQPSQETLIESQNTGEMLMSAQSATPIVVHGDHLCPTPSFSHKSISAAAGPAIAVNDVMASFVADKPRTASRVQSLAEASTSRDITALPVAESSTAAALRHKLAELSLHQQENNEVSQRSQTASARQRISEPSRTTPTSSSSLTQSVPSLESSRQANHAESKGAKSLYKLSRGRSDHVSPSRRWDRRGASASVLSGNSGSGSGGEDSEITVRPGRSSRHPRTAEHLPGPNQTIATLTSRGPSPSLIHLGSPTGTSHSSLSRKSSFRRHNSNLSRWTDSKPPSVVFEQDTQQGPAKDDEEALRADSLGHVTSSDEEGADASKFARRRRVSLERDRRRGMRMLLASEMEDANRPFVNSTNGRTSSVDKHDSKHLRNRSSDRRTRSEETGDLRLTPTSEGPSTCASVSTSTSATPTTVGDDISERSSLLSRSSSSDAIECAAPAGLTPCTPRRSRMKSAGENAECSIFGLADDEQLEETGVRINNTLPIGAEEVAGTQDIDDIHALDAMPTSGALSSCALAAALSKRATHHKVKCQSTAASSTKIRSMPASRRPSHPETSMPGASASSVPHRTSVILGFAPSAASTLTSSSSSTTPSLSHHSTIPRRKAPANRFAFNRSLLLSVSPRGNRQEDVTPLHLDLLSGSSVGSVEEFITVDQVEWASDREETASNARRNRDNSGAHPNDSALNSRRSSMISVRQGDADLVSCSGPPTVAALEAGSLLSNKKAGGSRGLDSDSHSSMRDEPPLSPTATEGPIFSKEYIETNAATPRQGFAAAYQDRISNLQSQLRLWSRDRDHSSASSESDNAPPKRRDKNVNESADSAESSPGSRSPPSGASSSNVPSGLLASSWKQIARLPNLFFHAGNSGGSPPNKASHSSEVPASAADEGHVDLHPTSQDGVLTRSTSHDADVSSLTDNHRGQISPASSPNSSDFDLRRLSDSDAKLQLSGNGRRSTPRISHGRSPSLGSRGVISPQDGDVDPGAYITGLGHRIDPDVELASVVHMHAIRNHRGRSVDTSRRSQGSHHQQGTRLDVPTAPLRDVASDSESIAAKHDKNARVQGSRTKTNQTLAIPPLALPETKKESQTTTVNEDAILSHDETARSSVQADGKSKSRRTRSRARFTIRDDEEGEAEDGEIRDDGHLEEHASQEESKDTKPPLILVSAEKQGPSHNSDGFTVVRAHRARGRPGVSRPAAEAPVPVDFSAYGEMSSSASDEDSPSQIQTTRSNKSRERELRGEQKGPSSTDMSRSCSGSRSSDRGEGHNGSSKEDLANDRHVDELAGIDEDDRNTSARDRRGRGRERGSRNTSPQATPRSRQCAVGLFSASSKQGRGDGSAVKKDASAKIASVTCSNLGVRTVRSSPDLTYASVAAHRPDRRGTSNSGRANGGPGSRPVSDDSSDDERSRRGRARGVTKVTSSSFKESECPRNSLPRSASAGDFKSLSFSPSSPQAVAAQAQALQMRQRQQASSPASMQDSATMDQTNGASAGLLPGSAPPITQSNGSSAAGGLLTLPNRPSLLSNSAHLLMLSLELEMMRAQKISAPLRIRWARQRTTISPTLILDNTSPSESATSTVQADPDVCATSGSEATAVGPNASPINPPICAPEVDQQSRDPVKGNPLYSSLSNARQLYAYRPRRGSQLRNVVDAQ